jgi:hypothetical protein
LARRRDYEDMNEPQWSEADVDALLRGKRPADAELAHLAPWVVAMRAGLDVPPSAETVSAAAATLSAAAASAKPTPVRSLSARGPRTVWVRRATFGGIAALALGFGVAGAAAAADSAAPGDALYGLDRAFEKVGIDDGGFPERVGEAGKLCDRGDDDDAMHLLADSLPEGSDDATKQVLLDLGNELKDTPSIGDPTLHAAVDAMLAWMATTDLTGREFGQGVAEHAHAIGESHRAAKSEDANDDNGGNSGDDSAEDASDDKGGNSGKDSAEDESDDKGNSSGKGNSGKSDDSATSDDSSGKSSSSHGSSNANSNSGKSDDSSGSSKSGSSKSSGKSSSSGKGNSGKSSSETEDEDD